MKTNKLFKRVWVLVLPFLTTLSAILFAGESAALTMRKPVQGAAFTAPASVLIEVVAVDPDGDIRLVEFFANGQFIGKSEHLTRDAVIPGAPREHILEWNNVAAGSYSLVAKANSTAGLRVESAPVSITVHPPDPGLVLIPAGAEWRHWNRRTAPGVNWNQVDFNDTEWLLGRAELGYGDGDEVTRTEGAALDVRPVSAYFRHSFDISNPESYTSLVLNLVRDDGAIVYLNGRQILRNNMPDGPVTPETLAVSTVGGDDERLFRRFELPSSFLQTGRNLLGVEVHQVNISSSDLSFNLELKGSTEPVPETPVVSITATDADAAESGLLTAIFPGKFLITRTGLVERPLTVYVAYEGTATMGLDYSELPRQVVIREGARSAELTVLPKNDGVVEGTERVVAKILPPPEGTPYSVDTQLPPAVVEIRDADQSTLPIVSIAATTPETSEPSPLARVAPGVFTLSRTGDPTTALTVYLAVGGTANPESDYQALPQVVTFEAGATSTKLLVSALDDELVEPDETVVAELIYPPDLSPALPKYAIDRERRVARVIIHDSDVATAATLQITSPPSGAVFALGAPIEIKATAIDPKGYIPRVEFYASDRLIGVSEIAFFTAPDPGTPIHHSFLWKGAPLGRHVLTARAKDSAGNSVVSPPVEITVTDSLPPQQVVLGIEMRDSVAAEVGSNGVPDPAVFVIRRTGGPTDVAVTALYSLTGTASNGVDYLSLSGQVHLPAGRLAVEVVIKPIPDKALEGDETVLVSLEAPNCIAIAPPPPECYTFPELPPVKAIIKDHTGNLPPTVAITQPRDGAVFTVGQVIQVSALARDPDAPTSPESPVARLEIFADEVLLGSTTLPELTVSWNVAKPGSHTLVAKATDHAGAITRSAPVRIMVVEVDTVAFVKRELPAGYLPGRTFTVHLFAAPPHGTSAYAVEDQPPTGWPVTTISHEGVFDAATGKVKFGPFLDGNSRTLSYQVTPPSTASGRYEFSGSSAANATSYPIAGDRIISGQSALHPADADADNNLVLAEVTAYAAAWKEGVRWETGPVPIPLNFVTRAGSLWRNGEKYIFDPLAGTPPLCWIPPNLVRQGFENVGSATRSIIGSQQPGAPLDVRITITPGAESSAYALLERVPHDWTVSTISGEGHYDPEHGLIRWGLFLDALPRVFEYRATPPAGVATVAELTGVISVDGIVQEIHGQTSVVASNEGTALALPEIVKDSNGGVVLQLSGPVGQRCVLEGSTDLLTWEVIESVFLPDGVLQVADSPAASQKYYRLRVQ